MSEFLSACYDYLGTIVILSIILLLIIDTILSKINKD